MLTSATYMSACGAVTGRSSAYVEVAPSLVAVGRPKRRCCEEDG